MKESDRYIIKAYNNGWFDCSNDKDNSNLYNGKKKKAYNLGHMNYIIGDEISSVDSWTDEEILKKVK